MQTVDTYLGKYGVVVFYPLCRQLNIPSRQAGLLTWQFVWQGCPLSWLPCGVPNVCHQQLGGKMTLLS